MVLDTLTTREAVRRAALDDLVARADLAAVTIEAGADLKALDGLKVISLGKLRDAMTAALMVKLPPPPDTHAEVTTPATIALSAICPECDLPVSLTVKLTTKLTVDDSGAEIAIKAKASKMPHKHGQLSLDGAVAEADGQVTMDDLEIEDHRLRILRAVYDVCDERTVDPPAEPGPPPTLDVIAQRLELANESDRADLMDSLAGYSQLDEPLIEIVSVVGSPVEYLITKAGEKIVEEAEPDDEASAEPDNERGATS
jgi:hypothetical protein